MSSENNDHGGYSKADAFGPRGVRVGNWRLVRTRPGWFQATHDNGASFAVSREVALARARHLRTMRANGKG